mgnify:CR=1 FL=1
MILLKGNDMISRKTQKWGFLRETREAAIQAGIDADTGLHRTGLDEYLAVIFPNVTDWIHDKPFINRKRPDYRSPSLKLIIEFDGIQHYTSPTIIQRDEENTRLYENEGYRVIRIPYFIQLTNAVVKQLFDIDVNEPLFDEDIPSIGVGGENTPAFLCSAGVSRMAREFKKFPEQYKINLAALKSMNNDYLSGVSLLESAYDSQT